VSCENRVLDPKSAILDFDAIAWIPAIRSMLPVESDAIRGLDGDLVAAGLAQSATGTDDATAASGVRELSPRLFPRQLQRDSARFGAQAVGDTNTPAALFGSCNSLSVQAQSDATAVRCEGGKNSGRWDSNPRRPAWESPKTQS